MLFVQQIVDNDAGDGHYAKDCYEAHDRHRAKDQLRWVLHCLLTSMGSDVLPPVATPFAPRVAPAMAYAAKSDWLRVASCEPY